MSEAGFIYAIGAEGLPAVKIGKTARSVVKRLALLQTCHPAPLKILATVPVEQDLSRIEKAIHRFLASERQRGEWFAVQVDQEQLESLIVRAVQWLAEADARAQSPLRETTDTQLQTFGERIRLLRDRAKLSQTQLGAKVDLSFNSICAMEKGRVDPKASKIRQIARVLGVSTDYLLCMDQEDKDSEQLATAIA
jgi:DNA-binding XRE family transcriptional regulator